ncbi:unnamed protein product [Rhizoctonia solani]|uniref:Uncharacterized protein n=1 Tax=Rhizoctonia solani TaxID=456999 RepID=A0A8H3GE91_9AGAM|nr:unnamed protein product [Rhizoctonia solani]
MLAYAILDMLPRSLSEILAKVLTRHREQSLDSHVTTRSLPDCFDVGLTYDWSDGQVDAPNTRPELTTTPSYTSTSPSSITSSPLKIGLSHTFTPSHDSGAPKSGLEGSLSSLGERDVLNEPLRSLMNPSTIAILQSPYVRKLSTIHSLGFQYQTPLTSPRSLPVALPPSPASSARTRPLFLPSPFVFPTRSSTKIESLTLRSLSSSTLLQVGETHSSVSSKHKRKETPSLSFDTPVRWSKRHRTEMHVIDVDHGGEDSDYDWSPSPHGDKWAGPFALRTPTLATERTPPFSIDENETHSTSPYSNIRQTHVVSIGTWPGAEGGAITFRSKPAKYNEKALSRWSYSERGPKNSTANERAEGDIHFSPSGGIGTNEPFNYWVCVKNQDGLRWVDFSCGQPHPLYKGFVLKPANKATKGPPKWVKAASYRASRGLVM